MSFEWMAWTPVTAGFFITIALILMGMTVWQVVSPSIERKGFLPIPTTRGDRLFIGLLGCAYISLAYIGLTDWNFWYALPIHIAILAAAIKYG